jgi:hypothetical protein
MRKSIIAASFLLLTLSAFGQGTRWFDGSFEEALTKAGTENKLIFVFPFSSG